MRYCFEIADGFSPDDCFAYVDTEEHLAGFLFSYERVGMTIEEEFGADGDPYRIILCRVPRERRAAFLKVIDLLPGLMAYAGRKDYDAYCTDLMTRAAQCFRAGPARSC